MRVRRRVWTVTAMVLAITTGAAACSDDGTDPGPSGEAAAPTNEPQAVDNATEKFGVTLPAGWKAITIDAGALERLLQEQGGKLDQAIANQVRTLAGRGGKLFAYDESHRTTNLNILKVPAPPGVTLEQLAESLPAELGQQLRDVTVETVQVASGPAVRASGTQPIEGSGKNLLQLQYYVLAGESMFIIVLATDEPARDRPTLEGIGQSFRLLP